MIKYIMTFMHLYNCMSMIIVCMSKVAEVWVGCQPKLISQIFQMTLRCLIDLNFTCIPINNLLNCSYVVYYIIFVVLCLGQQRRDNFFCSCSFSIIMSIICNIAFFIYINSHLLLYLQLCVDRRDQRLLDPEPYRELPAGAPPQPQEGLQWSSTLTR